MKLSLPIFHQKPSFGTSIKLIKIHPNFMSTDNVCITHHYNKAHSNNNAEWNNKMSVDIKWKIIVQYEKEFWVKWI